MQADRLQQYTLFRYPMAHSYSPLIHQAFAEQFGFSLNYTQTEAEPQHLKEAINHFRDNGGLGANVTMPLKEEAFSLCEQLSSRAELAGSVNTLYWQGNILFGDNTDGVGLVRDITHNLKRPLKDKTVCILGAGGAAAGIIGEIIKEQPKKMVLCNRTKERAEILSARFNHLNSPLSVLSMEELNEEKSFDWIINTTPFSTNALLMPLKPHLVKNSLVYELAYAKVGIASFFAKWSKEHGANDVFDGLGMLVEQAAMSFSIWQNGRFPNTQPVIAALRQLLAENTSL